MKRVFVDRIASACGELGICLSEVQLEQFYQYYELLIERNKVMNLTAITEWEDVIYKHFIDSLSLVKVESILEDSNKHFIDVGTGAGFPGIPLKIVHNRKKYAKIPSRTEKPPCTAHKIRRGEIRNREAIKRRRKRWESCSRCRTQVTRRTRL